MTIDARLHDQVRSQPHPLLFVTISGTHLYGFPSPDSDYDLRGLHILPPRDLLSLYTPQHTVESSSLTDGLEIDLVTHDAHKFLTLMLKRNGYVLEQLYSPLIVHETPATSATSAKAASPGKTPTTTSASPKPSGSSSRKRTPAASNPSSTSTASSSPAST